MASLSKEQIAGIGEEILTPKLANRFRVKFRDYSLKLSGLELDRLQSQIIHVQGFNAFPKGNDVISITFEDDYAGILDSILTKINCLEIFLDIEVQLLDVNNNIMAKVAFGTCLAECDMYSGLSYGPIENNLSISELSNRLPDYDIALAEKSEWYQLAYKWLSSIRLSSRSVQTSKAFPSTVNRTVSFRKI